MGPLPKPIVGSKPLLHAFRENRGERVIPEDVVMLVDNDEVGVLRGVANALKDAPRILGVGRIGGRTGQIGGGLIFLVASFDAKFAYSRAVRSGACFGRY